jgi:ABC-type dipeptide/oligopeptide/nickel transport system permease subunit
VSPTGASQYFPNRPLHRGAAIFIVGLAFNLLGDGLRDAMDLKSTK